MKSQAPNERHKEQRKTKSDQKEVKIDGFKQGGFSPEIFCTLILHIKSQTPIFLIFTEINLVVVLGL
jgi:hypothetical protein